MTNVMWAGLAPAAGLGWLASWLRLRHFTVTVLGRFRDAAPDVKTTLLFKFTDAREVGDGGGPVGWRA